jgi:hypothetical protein
MNAGNRKQTENSDPIEQRKKLSFEQAEGLAPLPSQLARGAISQEFRAALWAALHSRLEYYRYSIGETSYVGDPWETILRDAHVYRDHLAIDDSRPTSTLSWVT